MEKKKILVLYKSKYGATARYAAMIKEALPCDVFEIEKYNFADAGQYEIIVAAGGVYASGVSCMKYIRRNLQTLADSKIAIFAVGASPFNEKAFQALREYNLKNVPFEIPMFYGRGAYDEERYGFIDRTLCRLLRKSLRKKDPAALEPWMEAFFEADGKSCDWTDRSYLEPLLKYIEDIRR